MLGSAICGCISPIAYLGATGSHAMAPPSAGEFIRIELPPSLEVAAPDMASAPESEAMQLQLQPAARDAGEPTAARGPALVAQSPAKDFTPPDVPGSVSEAAPPTVPVARIPVSLAGLSYDLAGGATSANAIQTEKSIQVAGASRTRITVRIDENAQIYVDAGKLASLLPADSLPQSQNGFVSFDQLRSSGIGVRYDAALDTIEMQPDGA